MKSALFYAPIHYQFNFPFLFPYPFAAIWFNSFWSSWSWVPQWFHLQFFRWHSHCVGVFVRHQSDCGGWQTVWGCEATNNIPQYKKYRTQLRPESNFWEIAHTQSTTSWPIRQPPGASSIHKHTVEHIVSPSAHLQSSFAYVRHSGIESVAMANRSWRPWWSYDAATHTQQMATHLCGSIASRAAAHFCLFQFAVYCV